MLITDWFRMGSKMLLVPQKSFQLDVNRVMRGSRQLY